MMVIKKITLIISKCVDGEFYEKRVVFDSFDKLEKYLCNTPDLKYFKVQIWRVNESSSQEDLF